MSKHIDSHQNPTIKSTARLRTRRGREQQGLIIVDGARELRRAIEGGVDVEAIFVPENESSDEWLAVCDTVYSVSDRALSKIAFGDRQEVVGVARCPNRDIDSLSLHESAKIAVLEGIEKPGNVGAIMRSADAAGMDAVVLVDAGTDLFNPNAIRASIGCIFSLQVAAVDFPEFVAWSSAKGFRHLLAKCDSKATDYRNVQFDGRCALVLGTEATGLTDKWNRVEKSESIYLPMRGVADSLNVSVAAGVLFYACTKASG